MIKAKELCKTVKDISHTRTLYELGAFGNHFLYRNGKHYRLFDCSGLIKYVMFEYYNNGVYTSKFDKNADTMIKLCSEVSTNMKDIEPGEAVWQPGHIGVYIGDGVVVESTPSWANGVQRVPISKRAGTKYAWKKHGKLPWVEYDHVNKEDYKTVQDIVEAIKRGDFGNGAKRKDNLYNYFQDLVNKS